MRKPARVIKPTTAYKLLQRIKRLILAEPRRLNMSGYLLFGTSREQLKESGFTARQIPECGTMGCIAGWINVLTAGFDYQSVYKAAKVIGEENADTAWLLFAADNSIYGNITASPGTKAHAQQAAKRIDAYCKANRARLEQTVVELKS